MAEKRTLKSWASEQVHKPNDKISNFDKLKAPYILRDYITWGDLYDAVGIEPPVAKEKPKPKNNKTERTLDDVATDLDKWQNDIDYANMRMDAYPTDSAEYKEAKDIYDTALPKVTQLKAEAQTFQLGKQKTTVEDDIAKKEEELRKAKDSDKPTSPIETELNKLKTKKEKLDTSIDTAETQAGTAKQTQSLSASAAALGLSTSDLTRPATAVEKIAKEASDAKGQVTPKVPGAPKAPTAPALTDEEQRQQALEVAGEDFELPETIFKNVPSLTKILDRYVKENWTESKLRKAIREDVWFRKNSAVIKQRYVQLYNYQDLVDTGQIDPQVPGNTQFEQDIAKLERQVADKARAMGSGIASDPDQIKTVARKMYLTNQGIDDPMTTDFIAAAIRPVTSTIGGVATQTYSGQALKDYQAIQEIARSNGLRVKDIIPGGMNERQVLEGIATGKLDANRIAQDTRILAQQGQPQYVRDLLSQGYNLDQVFAPYRQTMANLLEINADEIDLNDSTLRSAISDKGDMNIYDFKKTLKKDNRWQYTENAKQEVSDATLKILRDFGLQG
jgi:hypothetical protein